MTDLRHLIVDLRAHAHEVPEHIGALMRKAAAALDADLALTDAPRPAPFPPPGDGDPRGGKHRRPTAADFTPPLGRGTC